MPALKKSSSHPPVPPLLLGKDLSQLARWFLGRRSHFAASRRSASVPLRLPRSLADKVGMVIWPWWVHRYPGAARGLAEVLGVQLRTAERLIGGHDELSPKHLRRLADFLEASIATKQAVLAELRAHVEAAEKQRALNPHPGYRAGIAKWRREQAARRTGAMTVE